MSDDGCDAMGEAGPLLLVIKRLLTLKLGFVADGVDEAGFVDAETDADEDEDTDGLPFTATCAGVAATLPKIFGASVFIGGTVAGDEDIVADESSMEPKVTEEPKTTKVMSTAGQTDNSVAFMRSQVVRLVLVSPGNTADDDPFRKSVGIGRPFLYAFSSYGTEGVDKALQILRVRHPCI